MILPASKSVTTSSSSANRLPKTMANEKAFLECKAETLANAGCSWPETSPRTILGTILAPLEL